MDFQAARARLTEHLRSTIRDQKVLDAMGHVPREAFVPPDCRHLAYEDRPLPIGLGQTISQPFIVALMTQALEIAGSERVLELGTGSGYQTAILAELTRCVVTVERLKELADTAKQALDKLGYTNIEVHLTEETLGWSAGAPYDAIIVAAGAPKLPVVLLDQLAVAGRLVIPVGSRFEQDLIKVTKQKEKITTESLGACRFVSLIGPDAWEEE
ncbi:protein-L-isoaspartate(D-aspartate) O-methyltransferase [Chloroflexota bacterium]